MAKLNQSEKKYVKRQIAVVVSSLTKHDVKDPDDFSDWLRRHIEQGGAFTALPKAQIEKLIRDSVVSSCRARYFYREDLVAVPPAFEKEKAAFEKAEAAKEKQREKLSGLEKKFIDRVMTGQVGAEAIEEFEVEAKKLLKLT